MIQVFELPMQPLAESRKIRIYTPPSYHAKPERQFPVLFMHDGQNVFTENTSAFGMSWRVHDVLEKMGLEWIVAAADCSSEGYGRLDEYGPWPSPSISQEWLGSTRSYGGKGDEYCDWFTFTFKPWVEHHFRTLPEQTHLMGSSMGGLISTYMMCRYPNIYSSVASLSSAFWFNQQEMETLLSVSHLSGVKYYYMDVGTNEVTGPVHSGWYIEASERIAKLMEHKKISWEFRIISNAVHNETAWHERLPEILSRMNQKNT